MSSPNTPIQRSAGLDIYQETVVTITLTQADGTIQKQTRTFSTMTADFLALDAWLCELAIQDDGEPYVIETIQSSCRAMVHKMGFTGFNGRSLLKEHLERIARVQLAYPGSVGRCFFHFPKKSSSPDFFTITCE